MATLVFKSRTSQTRERKEGLLELSGQDSSDTNLDGLNAWLSLLVAVSQSESGYCLCPDRRIASVRLG